MSSSEKFCLRWNDFESNISVAFREIREEKDFFDCTLSCGVRQIQAHKLILSACSPFFRSILRQNPHQHPLLYLKGVEFTDLQAVLNFMYHGEVNVAQEELNSFLAVAEDLQVKGLTQSEGSKEKQKGDSNILKSKQQRESQEPKRSRLLATPPPLVAPPAYQDNEDDIQEVLPVVKSEPESNLNPYSTPATSETTYQHHQPQIAPVKYQPSPPVQTPMASQQIVQAIDDNYGYGGEENYDYGEYEGYEGGQLEADTSKGEAFKYVEKLDYKSFKCSLCGKSFTDRSNCTRHVKINHLGEVRDADTKQPCQYCGKYLVKRTIPHHVRNSCPKAPAYQL